MVSKYWATSPTTHEIPVKEVNTAGFVVEHNPKIKMYRMNGGQLPKELMGYELHVPILIKRLRQWKRKQRNDKLAQPVVSTD